jgi:glutamate racemase
MTEECIGVFDSGLGGLSVMKAVRELLPKENLHYFGDCFYAPYGDRSSSFIEERSQKITDYFLRHRAKAIVVACNTATAVAIPALRKKCPVPIIGIEPAIKPAVQSTRSGAVGVMATTRTLESDRFASLLKRFSRDDVRIVCVACKGLADAVEQGAFDTPETLRLLSDYLRPMQEAGCDRIVLGCTHYPFLTQSIRRTLQNDSIELIDPSKAVARQLKRKLEESASLSTEGAGRNFFVISGPADQHVRPLSMLWGEPVAVEGLSSI